MRRTSSIAVALALIIAALAPACVAGFPNAGACSAGRWPRSDKGSADHIASAASRNASKACAERHSLTATPGHCGFRSFVLAQMATPRPAAISAPRTQDGERMALAAAVTRPLAARASPHLDRGPPNS